MVVVVDRISASPILGVNQLPHVMHCPQAPP